MTVARVDGLVPIEAKVQSVFYRKPSPGELLSWRKVIRLKKIL